jgi:hypothetical protein
MPTAEECYEFTIGQIEGENNLINHRLTWSLTFEGFLFAAIALIGRGGKDIDPTLGWFIKYLVPILGSLVAFLAWDSVSSAYRAIRELQTFWTDLGQVQHFPPTALVNHGWLMKTFPGLATPGYSVPAGIGVAWLVLLMVELVRAALS